MSSSRRRLHLMAMLVAQVAFGCASEPHSEPYEDFYAPPNPLPSDVPGTLIRAEPMEPFADGTLAWRVLYVSTAVDGTPIAVSGMVASPSEPPPGRGRGVVSWAHGATGLDDRCTPSKGFRFYAHDFYDVAPDILAAGYVGVATDYEGLGTPGVHPFFVGPSEGRGLLDIAKAAQQIEEAGASERVVVWGHSQGGHAALFAGEIAPTWAPELDVLGVAATAPAAELQTVVTTAPLVPSARFLLWYIGMGFEAAYSELSIRDIFDADTLAAINALETEDACYEEFEAAGREFLGEAFLSDPLELPDWSDRLTESTPGYVRTEAPLLILHSKDDTSPPILLTEALVDRLCTIGSRVDYRVLEDLGHDETSRASAPLILDWAADRFAGEAAETTCE